MLEYKFYWSNICILSKYEEKYLNTKLDDIREKYNINISIEFFGLGKEKKLSEKLKEDLKNNIMPDIIVSTDLEIFENNDIYSKLKGNLRNINKYFDIAHNFENSNINRDLNIVPFLSIPLLIVANKDKVRGKMPTSIEEIIEGCNKNSVVFGGINNSAGTSVIKGIWYRFGKKKVIEFIYNSDVKQMPIQAFDSVRKGENAIGIVPSIFAQRAKYNDELEIIWPEDGAITVPSYIAINKSVNENVVEIIRNEIFSEHFCNFFVDRGDIISCLKGSRNTLDAINNNFNIIYPSNNWMDSMNNNEFLEVYKSVSL